MVPLHYGCDGQVGVDMMGGWAWAGEHGNDGKVGVMGGGWVV